MHLHIVGPKERPVRGYLSIIPVRHCALRNNSLVYMGFYDNEKLLFFFLFLVCRRHVISILQIKSTAQKTTSGPRGQEDTAVATTKVSKLKPQMQFALKTRKITQLLDRWPH